MAPPRKPTNVLALSGAFKHNPARAKARQGEPEAVGEVGDPPPRLPDPVATCWREIVGLAHEGTLGTADRLIVEHGAHLLAQLRAAEWRAHPTLLLRWEAFLAKLGLTPADRSRVQTALQKPGANPLDKFKRPADPYAEFRPAGD